MKLRTTTLVLILVAVLAVSAAAAGAKRAGAKAGMNGMDLPRLTKALGLNQQQVQDIRAIVQKYHVDVKSVMKSASSPADKKTAIAGLRTAAGDAIMALLTPEQQEKAKKMHAIKRLLMARRAAVGLMSALQQLDLSEDQKAQTKTIIQDSHARAQTVRQDQSLTPEQKAAQLKALHKETMDKIMSVLTAEQQQKLKDMLAKRPRAGRRK